MEKTTATLTLTKEERECLVMEVNCILRQFDTTSYNGRQFTNPHVANAFNTVFKSLTGKDHHNCRPHHYNRVVKYHIKVMENHNYSPEAIDEFRKMLKETD